MSIENDKQLQLHNFIWIKFDYKLRLIDENNYLFLFSIKKKRMSILKFLNLLGI